MAPSFKSVTISPISLFLLRLLKFAASYVPLSLLFLDCFNFVINFSIILIRILNCLRLWKKKVNPYQFLTMRGLLYSSNPWIFILLPISLSLSVPILSLTSKIVCLFLNSHYLFIFIFNYHSLISRISFVIIV